MIWRILKRLFGRWFASRVSLRDAAGLAVGRRAVVRGRVVPRDLIESPLTGTPCVYYRSLVEELRSTNAPIPGVRGGIWHATDRDEAIAEFYLEQDGSRAVIAPEGAHVRVEADRVALPEEGRRGFEAVLRAGDVVEVVGEIDAADDPYDDGRGYREEPVRVVLRAGRRPLKIRRV